MTWVRREPPRTEVLIPRLLVCAPSKFFRMAFGVAPLPFERFRLAPTINFLSGSATVDVDQRTSRTVLMLPLVTVCCQEKTLRATRCPS